MVFVDTISDSCQFRAQFRNGRIFALPQAKRFAQSSFSPKLSQKLQAVRHCRRIWSPNGGSLLA